MKGICKQRIKEWMDGGWLAFFPNSGTHYSTRGEFIVMDNARDVSSLFFFCDQMYHHISRCYGYQYPN